MTILVKVNNHTYSCSLFNITWFQERLSFSDVMIISAQVKVLIEFKFMKACSIHSQSIIIAAMAGECNAKQYLIKMRKNFPLSINIYKFMCTWNDWRKCTWDQKLVFKVHYNAIQVILVGDNAWMVKRLKTQLIINSVPKTAKVCKINWMDWMTDLK